MLTSKAGEGEILCAHEFMQPERIPERIPSFVVIKVYVDRLQVLAPFIKFDSPKALALGRRSCRHIRRRDCVSGRKPYRR
jgi:hypothetical protein